MTISSDPRYGDIWLAYVEFADHPGVGKVRPVVVLEDAANLVVAAKITTSNRYERSEYLEISDWESAGLRRRSWIQLNPLIALLHEKFLRNDPIGRLSLNDADILREALANGG